VLYYHLKNVRRIRKYLSAKATQTLANVLIIGRIHYFNSILYGLPNLWANAPSYICELININESGGYNLRSNKGLLL
ncbi:unnamed protein product, partial [Porites evermanni]